MLMILAALTYAACIMATEKVTQNADPVTVGMLQLGVMGLLSLIVALASGDFSLPQGSQQFGMLLLLVLLCSCFGFPFQPVGQKYLPAETAAVFTVVNPLTASVMGIAVGGEGMSFLKLVGYVLILLALLGRFFDHDRAVYVWVTGLTLVAAFYDLLRTLPDHLRAVLHVNGLVDTVGKALPFATIGLGWICPAILGLVIGLIFRAVRPKKA